MISLPTVPRSFDDATDASIELFFWKPQDRRTEYISHYESVYPGLIQKEGGVRYPRLLFLREDCLFTLWKDIDPQTKNVEHPFDGVPHFATILILRSMIELLVKGLFASKPDSVIPSEYESFFKTYLALGGDEAYALFLLRNSIIHDGYALKCQEKGVEYKFVLSFDQHDIVNEDLAWPKIHPNERRFIVNHSLLHEKLEEAVLRLKSELLGHGNYDLYVNYATRLAILDEWILVDG